MSKMPHDKANGVNGTNGVNGDAAKIERQQQQQHDRGMMPSSVLSTSLPPNDPANPQNWPLYKKVFTSIQGWLFGFTV
jgi:hypothetical protein